MKSGKVLLGLLAGLSVGTVLGILFAPDKGTSTRKKISHGKDEYLDDLGQKVNNLIESVSGKLESVKEDAVRIAANGKAKMEDTENKFKSVTR